MSTLFTVVVVMSALIIVAGVLALAVLGAAFLAAIAAWYRGN